MKWVADNTGRFRRRPQYTPEEIDNECELIITDFLREKYGKVSFPFSTDDLAVLIERDTSELDLYADLAGDGEDIEGVTDFFARRKPAVRIARELSEDSAKARRLRTTLAHEYGHVKFHYFLWDQNFKAENPPDFWKLINRQRRKVAGFRKNEPSKSSTAGGPQCRHSLIIEAPENDWMEWQAGYAAGALLMPLTPMKKLVGENRGEAMVIEVATIFDVSLDAARARLFKLGLLPGIVVKDENVKDSVSYKE